MKKSLLFLAIFSIATFSNIEVKATSLNDLFLSEDVKVTFDDGTIHYNGANVENGSVNDTDYIYKDNTYFIDMNIIPNLGNTRNNNAKYILSGIKGSDNISLQSQNSNVPTSLMFSGDNREFTGTLYLHPAINELYFLNQESIINNINIPKLKDSNKKKCITIGLPDNSSYYKNVKIPSNLSIKFDNNPKKYMLINKLHVLKDSRFVVNNFPLILGKQVSDIKTNLNITSGNYKANPLTTIINCIATARYDEEIGDSIFEYTLSCNKCSTTIDPLVCKYCDTSLSELLSHTGAVNPGNKQYFLDKGYVLHKLLNSGNTKCSNLSCKYNFDKSKINMKLQSELSITEEDIVDETTKNTFVIQNKYSCSACGTDLERGIIKSDPIDIAYQPLKDVKQNITNFIEILKHPDKYTVPEFCKYFIPFNSVQLRLLQEGVAVVLQKEDNEKQKYISDLICDAKLKYDDMIIMAYNSIEDCYDLTTFRNEINHNNISISVKCFYDFQNLIFSYIKKKTEEEEKKKEESESIGTQEDPEYLKLTQVLGAIQGTFPDDVLQNLTEIINNINEYYSINTDDPSNVILSKNDEIIKKFEKLLNNEAVEFEEEKSVVLGDQIEQLLTVQNKFQKDHTNFLGSIIGTKCKVCNATFIE